MADDLRKAVEGLRDRMAQWPEAVVPRGSVAHRLTAILDAHPDQGEAIEAMLREARSSIAKRGKARAYDEGWLHALEQVVSILNAHPEQEVERCGGSGLAPRSPLQKWPSGPCPGCPDCQPPEPTSTDKERVAFGDPPFSIERCTCIPGYELPTTGCPFHDPTSTEAGQEGWTITYDDERGKLVTDKPTFPVDGPVEVVLADRLREVERERDAERERANRHLADGLTHQARERTLRVGLENVRLVVNVGDGAEEDGGVVAWDDIAHDCSRIARAALESTGGDE